MSARADPAVIAIAEHLQLTEIASYKRLRHWSQPANPERRSAVTGILSRWKKALLPPRWRPATRQRAASNAGAWSAFDA